MKEFIEKISREAGKLALGFYTQNFTVSNKTDRLDLLTSADVAVSEFLVSAIHKEYPSHHIHSEEMEVDINPGADYEWVIDPIDGTWNFANHIPIWGSLIAVINKGETTYAGIYFPIDDFFYWAEKDAGAFCNGNPIRVSAHAELKTAVGSASASSKFNRGEAISLLWKKLYDHKARIRNHGCMYGTALVANGVMDFFITNSGKDHDYLVPALLVREAGGIVTDTLGNEWQRGMEDIVIASPKIHQELMKLLAV